LAGIFFAQEGKRMPLDNNQPINPYFKQTATSVVMPLAHLIRREAPDPQRLKNAHERMAAARRGTFAKRKPIGVVDLGDGTFRVVDGNTTFHALLELGESEAVVEVLKG
jgi:hypothetical protein